MSEVFIKDEETRRLVAMFNNYTIADYGRLHNEDHTKYTDAQAQNILETHKGIVAPGAIYRWPAQSGDKIHVTGFGLIELNNELWFLAGFNSKKLGRPKIEKLFPKEVLKMLEWGEVEYVGNIMNPAFRKSFDYERLSLAIIGFASLVMTTRMQKNVSVDEIMHDLETGKMTMDDLLAKCGNANPVDLMI